MAGTKNFVGRELVACEHDVFWRVAGTLSIPIIGLVRVIGELAAAKYFDAAVLFCITASWWYSLWLSTRVYRDASQLLVFADYLVVKGQLGEIRIDFSDIKYFDTWSQSSPRVVLQDNTKVPVPNHYQIESLAKWIDEQKALKALTSAAHPASESSPSQP